MYGCTQIYYGFGKGKTTTAIGNAVRAAGANLNVEFVQFLKDGTSSEFKSLIHVPNLTYFNPEIKGFINPDNISNSQLQHSYDAYNYAVQKSLDENVNMLVCDEILWTFELNLLTHNKIKELIKNKHKNLELILTGSMGHPDILELADYITEFKCIKHPFYEGLTARLGIEY